ncbi:hypothetical protein K439DRAFT_1366992 [Ramaria rubella]|nr:hypothetical protein K439DRAFT_1366992 [Ramaria rubella]
MVAICKSCLKSLKSQVNKPPALSLANRMWIGHVPWQLQVLSIPEQLLIAPVYPRVFVFKLTYKLNQPDVVAMIKGNLMPQPQTILASLLAVTFIGHGDVPKSWLKTTFRVRRQFVYEALLWLKTHNLKYYGNIDIDATRISSLPEDNVPHAIL